MSEDNAPATASKATRLGHSCRKRTVAWICLGVALLFLTGNWWFYGLRFYDRVLPFYDSASYQDGYRTVAAIAKNHGSIRTLIEIWKEPASNVVLYRFAAAAAGPWVPHPRTGLFIYLFTFHALAGIVLYLAVRDITGRVLPAFAATSVWFLTQPFGMLRDGVGDQRMDLSSGSAFLLVAAMGLRWSHRPTGSGAFLTGIAAALAALHRPILTPSIAIVGVLLAIAAVLAHRRPLTEWLRLAGLALSPIFLIAAPWLLHHQEELRVYYLENGPDVGASTSMLAAAKFHWASFQASFGLPAALTLVVGLALVAFALRPHFGRAVLVVLLAAAPLAILVASKSSGNIFVQQASLGIPALLFAAWHPQGSDTENSSKWDIPAGSVFLLVAMIAAPVRLAQALAIEPAHERREAVGLLQQIELPSPQSRIAGFHDLPISPLALCMLARDLNIPLTTGTLSYYPTDFGLANDYLNDSSSEHVRSAVIKKLEVIKQQDDLVILPTADTEFRLWQGLYSHRLLPLIRTQIQTDAGFEIVRRVGPVKEVYFDVYRIRRDQPSE